MITRKQQRFCYLLLFCLMWQGNLAYAQDFDPITPVETLVQEVSDGTASVTQFEALQDFAAKQALNTEINNLLGQESTTKYFEENFKEDGFYGEKKDGLIIEDWENLAKGMGTTGAVLAGAYAVWRRRRQDYLARLRAGDTTLIENLFASPGYPINGTTDQWEQWAADKGVPGAGVLLSSLYAVWARREDRSDDTFGDHQKFITGVYNSQEERVKKDDFIAAFIPALAEKKSIEEAKILEQFIAENPEPIYPEAPEPLKDLGNINEILTKGIDLEALGIPKNRLRLYGSSGIYNQARGLMRYNELSADIVAEQVISALENLQRGYTAVLEDKGYRNPDFKNINIRASYSSLSSNYYRLQRDLSRSWFGKNYRKITDPVLKARLSKLRSEPLTANKQKYLEEARELAPILSAQNNHILLKRNWDNALSLAQAQNNQQYASIGYEARAYWAHRYNENFDDENWENYLSDFAVATDQGLAEQAEISRAEFKPLVLTEAPVWAQFESWLVAAPVADVDLVQADIEQIKSGVDTDQALDRIYDMRAKWLMSPSQLTEITKITTEQQLGFTNRNLASDPVEKWVKVRDLDKEFYQKYGIENREEHLAFILSEKEKRLEYLEALIQNPAYLQKSIHLSEIAVLKREVETLKGGKLPNHHWSLTREGDTYYFGRFIPAANNRELRELYYKYASASSLHHKEYWRNLVIEKETEVFGQRAIEWDADNPDTIADLFTEEQIAHYEALKSQKSKLEISLGLMKDQQVAEKLSLVDQIKSSNQASKNEDITAFSFSASDLQQISNQVVPSHLKDVLYESFRRFQADEEKFAAEAQRLASQASKNEERDLIIQNNIPKAPVETHYVVQFPHAQTDLNTWNQAVTSLQDDIITQQDLFDHLSANLPSLERSMTVAGQVYGINSTEYLDRKNIHDAAAHNVQVTQNKINGYQSKIIRYQKDILDLERVFDDMKIEYDQYQVDHASYEHLHAPVLAAIRSQLVDKYDVSTYTSSYFASAELFVTESNDYAPTDPDQVELVETAPDSFETVDFDLHWQELESDLVAVNPAFRSAQEATNAVVTKNTWDDVSDENIKTLNPLVQTGATKLINQVESELGIKLRIASGLRTRAEQSELYAQGRENDGDIVTNAEAGYSYHNYGQAIDVAPLTEDLQETDYNISDSDWSRIGEIGRSLGFDWGGDWGGDFVDKPHFEMSLGKTIVQLQEQYDAGLLVDGSYFDPQLETEADIRLVIIENIKKGFDPYSVQLASAGTFGLARAKQLRAYGETHPDWVLAMEQTYGEISVSENNDQNRWEDEVWITQMVENIKLGRADFIGFVNSPREEKLAIITAAKEEYRWWKVWNKENGNLGDFIGQMEDHLEIEAVKLQFFSLINQSVLTVTPVILETLSHIASQALVTPAIALKFKSVVDNLITFNTTENPTEPQHESLAGSIKDLGLQIANNSVAQSALEAVIGNWHFEERLAKNVDLPSYEEIIDKNNLKSQGWHKLGLDKSLLHDDFDYYREIKHVHEDGREVIYDGETYEILRDPDLMGTYNYGVLLPENADLYENNVRNYAYDYLMHSFLDVFPYYAFGGNVR